jgi:hypothetical protein
MPVGQEVVINLMRPRNLLQLFRNYVDQCIEDTEDRFETMVRPLSFDEWCNREYLPNIDSLTQIVVFELCWISNEKNRKKDYKCRIPADIVSDDGQGIFDLDALIKSARELTKIKVGQKPCVNFNKRRLYHWSHDQ